MTEEFRVPSFKSKDLNDEFYYVGRIKSQQVESAIRNGSNGEWQSVQLHVIHERLDAETITTRHSFFRIPSGTITPGSPLGRYIKANDDAQTPFTTGGGTLEELNTAVQEQEGNIYVLCHKSIPDRSGREPGRYSFPIVKIGYGNEWDAEEGKRIIDELRQVVGKGAAKVAVAAAKTPSTPMPSPTTTPAAQLVQAVIGMTLPEATQKAMNLVPTLNVPQPAVLMAELGNGEKFWQDVAASGLCAIENGRVTAP